MHMRTRPHTQAGIYAQSIAYFCTHTHAVTCMHAYSCTISCTNTCYAHSSIHNRPLTLVNAHSCTPTRERTLAHAHSRTHTHSRTRLNPPYIPKLTPRPVAYIGSPVSIVFIWVHKFIYSRCSQISECITN